MVLIFVQNIALIIHGLMLLCQLALPSLRWAEVIPAIAPAVLTLYPLGFYPICSHFIDYEERFRWDGQARNE